MKGCDKHSMLHEHFMVLCPYLLQDWLSKSEARPIKYEKPPPINMAQLETHTHTHTSLIIMINDWLDNTKTTMNHQPIIAMREDNKQLDPASAGPSHQLWSSSCAGVSRTICWISGRFQPVRTTQSFEQLGNWLGTGYWKLERVGSEAEANTSMLSHVSQLKMCNNYV